MTWAVAGKRGGGDDGAAHWALITCDNRLLGHVGGYVRALAVVDDGGRPVVVAAGDHEIRAWHLDGTPYSPVLTGLPARIKAMTAVSRPTSVEVRTWHTDGTTQAWHLPTATPLCEAQSSPEEPAGLIERLVVTQAEATLRLRDHASYERAGDALVVEGLTGVLAVRELDGRPLVIVRLGDRNAQVWDLTGRRPLGPVLEPLANADPAMWSELWSGALTLVGGRLIAALGQTWSSEGDAKVTFWDVEEARPVAPPMTGQQIGIFSVAVLEPGERPIVCAGGADGRLAFRDWTDREEPGGDLPFLAHDGGIDALAGTGETLLSGGRDGTVRAWSPDVRVAARDRTAARDRGATVDDIVAVDGLSVGLSRADRSLTTWDAETGEVRARWTVEGAGRGHLAALHAGGRPLVVVATPDRLVLWDAATGERAPVPPIALPEGDRPCLSTGRLGGTPVLLAVGLGGKALLWDARTETALEFACAAAGRLGTFAQVGGEPYIVGRPNGRAPPGLWRIPSGEAAPRRFQPCAHEHHREHPDLLTVGVLDDRPVAVGVGGHSSVDVWDLRTADLVRTGRLEDGHGMVLTTTAVGSLNGRQVAVSGGYAGSVIIWDLDGVRQVIHAGGPLINALALEGDRRIIASGLMGVTALEFP